MILLRKLFVNYNLNLSYLVPELCHPSKEKYGNFIIEAQNKYLYLDSI